MPPIEPVYREDAILEDIVARLRQTNYFGPVDEGNPETKELPDDLDGRPAKAWVQRHRATTLDRVDSDPTDEISPIFYIWIETRDDQSVRAFRNLCLAESLARNALRAARVADVCQPAFSRVGDVLDDPKVQAPRRRARLTFTCRYQVDTADYDITDRSGEDLP